MACNRCEGGYASGEAVHRAGWKHRGDHMQAERPRCVIADDHEIVLQGLASELASSVEIVGRASNGFEAIALVLELHPELLFLDVLMPGPGVGGVLELLRAGGSTCRVLVFSSIATVDRIKAAFGGGAWAYLSKDAPAATLQLAVSSVQAGQQFLDPILAPKLLLDTPSTLSARECRVLQMMANGDQNAGIATGLGISEETVKSHVSHILQKLACSSRTQAVAAALRGGVVD